MAGSTLTIPNYGQGLGGTDGEVATRLSVHLSSTPARSYPVSFLLLPLPLCPEHHEKRPEPSTRSNSQHRRRVSQARHSRPPPPTRKTEQQPRRHESIKHRPSFSSEQRVVRTSADTTEARRRILPFLGRVERLRRPGLGPLPHTERSSSQHLDSRQPSCVLVQVRRSHPVTTSHPAIQPSSHPLAHTRLIHPARQSNRQVVGTAAAGGRSNRRRRGMGQSVHSS